MDAARARELLDVVTRALASLKSKSKLLEEINWPRAVEERFFAGGASELPEVAPSCDRDLLNAENATLTRVEQGIDGEGAIPDWLRRVVRGVIDRNRLLMAAGTPEFGRLSREIYGGAATVFLGLGLRNIDLADHLLERLRVHGWDEATDHDETPMPAPAFAAELQARIDKHRPSADVAVVLDEQCTAKALAGMTRVRVRADATFSSWEADGLFCHEVETHAFTALNGAAQASAPFLRAGGPRTTPTQEGLAVFSELMESSMDVKTANPNDRRVVRTHRMLREALIALIIERGWENVTVQDICDRADIGRSTFYTHFADKEELLLGGFDDLRKMLRAQKSPLRDEKLAFVRGLIEHAAEHSQLFRAIIGKRAGHVIEKRFRQTVIALVKDDLASHGLNGRALDVTTCYVAGALVELLTWWIDSRNALRPAEIEAMFRRLTTPVLAASRSMK